VEALDAVIARCVEAAAAVEHLDRPGLLADAALVVEARAGTDAGLVALRSLAAGALAALPADDHTLRARLLGQLATLAFYLDPPRCERLSAEALAAADLSGDPLAIVAATRARQMARSVPAGAEERLELALLIGEAGRALGRPSVQLWEPLWRIDALLELGRVPEAVATLSDVRRRVAEAPLPMARWHLARVESVLAQATGRFADAIAAGSRARDLFAVLETPAGADAILLGLRNQIADHIGYDDAILRGWEQILEVGPYPPYLGDLPWLGPIPAACAAGRSDLARSWYARLAPVASWQLPPFLEIPLLTFRLLAAIGLDRNEDVAALVERLGPFRGRHAVGCAGVVSYGGCVEGYLGKAQAVLGRWDAAVADLRRALTIAEEAGTPSFAVEVAADLAHALVGRGRPGDAGEAAGLVGRYRPEAVALGMRPWTVRFDAVPAPAARVDAGPLTPRELEVAGLVAGGSTNRQIAAELYLSERTAQNHVQHILTKLGLANRTQIATWYRERRAGSATEPSGAVGHE
jgi:DNA-binding CsgD family transcriptional regulator